MEVLYDRDQKPKETEFINYLSLARSFFGAEQQFVPFLGAGASLHASGDSHPPKLTQPEQESIDSLYRELKLETADSRDFLELAARVAKHMELALAAPAPENQPSGAAPSAVALAATLAAEIGYRHLARSAETLEERLPRPFPNLEAIFKSVISITGVASAAPPLLSVASYYQYRQSDEGLWDALYPVFAKVTRPTETHRLIAEIAHNHIHHSANAELPKRQRNYLVITTNYDDLIERAMSDPQLPVPYCVVTVPKQGDRVRVRFSELAGPWFGYTEKGLERLRLDLEEEAPGVKNAPANFHLEVPRPVAIVYKVHGCLAATEKSHNSVIISDEDYIDNLGKNGTNAHLVPNTIKTQLGYCDFLFLGYSFSDWNVRSLFKSVRGIRQSASHQDYAVLKSWHPYESKFFEKYDIKIAATDLDTFAKGIRKARNGI